MYDPIIFDLDGTLLNTLGDLAAACNHALEEMGLPTHAEPEYKLFVGNGMAKLIERSLPENASEEDKRTAHALFSEYYELHKADRTAPYAGIAELLAELKKRGITAVCCTNKDHKFSVELLSAFFGENLAEVIGAGIGYPRKPDPAAALFLAKKYPREGASPLYVGDSGIDMHTARNAGLDACGVLWGFRGREELEKFSPEFLVKDAAELRRIILGEI